LAALLEYNIAVVGQHNVDTALSSLERKFGRHNDKIEKGLNRRSQRVPAGKDPAKIAEAEQKKLARAVQAEEKRAAREAERQTNYWAKARQQQTMRNLRLEEQGQNRLQKSAQRERQAQERFIRSTVGGTASRVWGTVKAVGTAAAATLGLSGAALAASSISEASKLDDIARRTAIQGRADGEQGMDPNELRKKFSRTAIETGIAPEAVAAGVSRYVDRTGDLAGGVAHMKTFATLAQASGAQTSDLADSAWALRQAGVTSEPDVQKALATLYGQGKKGSFKLSDQAQYLPGLIARGRDFGVRGTEGIKGLGGLLQITQDATGDAAETATGVADMFSELTQKAGKMASGKAFSGRKVNVYEKGDAKNGARNIRDIVGDTLTASRGDSTQIEEVFGKRAIKPLMGMINTFKDTRTEALKNGDKESVATQKGHDAALKIWDQAADVKGDFQTVEKDAADAMKGFGAQMELLNTELKDVVASELFPELVKLAPDLKELVPYVAKATKEFVGLAKWLAENPLKGIGAFIAGAFAIELGKAALGQVVGSTIKRILSGGAGGGVGGGGVGVGGAGMLGGRLGAGLNILGAGIAGAGIGGAIGGAIGGENGATTGALVGGFGLAGAQAGGPLGLVAGASVGAAVDQYNDLQKANGGAEGLWGGVKGIFNGKGFLGGIDEVENRQAKAERARVDAAAKDSNASPAATANIDKLGTAADKLVAAADKISGAPPNRGNAPSPVKP